MSRWARLNVWPRVVAFDLDSTIWDGDIECTSGPPFKLSDDGRNIIDVRKDILRVYPDAFEIMGWLHQVAQRQRENTPWDDLKLSFNRKAVEQGEVYFNRNFKGRLPPDATAAPDGENPCLTDTNICLQVAWASRPFETSWAPKALKQLPVPGAPKTSFWNLTAASEIYPGDKTAHMRQIAKKIGCNTEEILFFDNEFRNIKSTLALGVTAIYTPDGISSAHFVEGLLTYAHNALR